MTVPCLPDMAATGTATWVAAASGALVAALATAAFATAGTTHLHQVAVGGRRSAVLAAEARCCRETMAAQSAVMPARVARNASSGSFRLGASSCRATPTTAVAWAAMPGPGACLIDWRVKPLVGSEITRAVAFALLSSLESFSPLGP